MHKVPCILSLYDDVFFFFQAEDGIRDLVRSRGLGDVYKRQGELGVSSRKVEHIMRVSQRPLSLEMPVGEEEDSYLGDFIEDEDAAAPSEAACLLYTSDAADERSSVDLGGRRIIKKKKKRKQRNCETVIDTRH